MDVQRPQSDGVGGDPGGALERIVDDILGSYCVEVVAVYRRVTPDGCRLEILKTQDESSRPHEGQDPFNVSDVCRQSAPCFVKSIDASCPYVDHTYASSARIQSAAFFHHRIGEESVVVVFAFRSAENFDAHGQDAVAIGAYLQERAMELTLALRHGDWLLDCPATLLELTDELTYSLRTESSLDELVRRIGELIYRSVVPREETATVSIWLADHPKQVLHCSKHFYAPKGVRLAAWELAFGIGLIGWVAQKRTTLNVVPRDPNAKLRDGTLVAEQYVPLWEGSDQPWAEVVVPMIYRGRLVGVLNLEYAEPSRFSRAFESVAEWLSTLAAAAIHQLQVDDLYRSLLGSSEIEALSRMVVEKAGNLIEAACCSFFSWDIESQGLRLGMRLEEIASRSPGEAASWQLGKLYYTDAGLGITRWAFEHCLPLVVSDVEAFGNPTHARHPQQIKEFCEQVLRVAGGQSISGEAKLEELPQQGNSRRLWELHVPEREPQQIWQPVWSATHVDGDIRTQSVMVVPVIGTNGDSGSQRELGVIRFARHAGEKPFTPDEVELVCGIARQSAQVLSRAQEQATHQQEAAMVAEVVTFEPGHFDKDFRERLREPLERIRDVIGADVVFVRGVEENGDLTLLASSDPTLYDSDTTAGGSPAKAHIAIPLVVREGCGVSGRAVAEREPVYAANREDPIWDSLASIVGSAHVQDECSLAAVPLVRHEDDHIGGVITAISSRGAEHTVFWDDGRWGCQVSGIQQSAVDVLTHHSRWLARVVAVKMDLVRSQRREFTLSTAVHTLAGIVGDDQRLPCDFFLPGMVMATHHNGFRFHQAFLAKCVRVGDGKAAEIRPWSHNEWASKWSSAWGCTESEEQDLAINQRQSLADDIRGTLSGPQACKELRERWTASAAIELAEVPTRPCILLRGWGYDELSTKKSSVKYLVPGQPGDHIDRLLDAFCNLYRMKRGSDPWRAIQVGMVPLDDQKPPNSVMFVTNIAFSNRTDCTAQEIFPKTLEGLFDLGRVFGLAQKIGERDYLLARAEILREELPHIIRAGLKTDLAVVARIEQTIIAKGQDTTVLDRFLGITMRILAAQRELCDVVGFHMVSGPPYTLPSQPEEVPIGEHLQALLDDFDAFFNVMNVTFTFKIAGETNHQHCLANRRQLEAVWAICLWTAYELVQGDEQAELRGISFEASAVDESFVEFAISHWGKELGVPSETVFQEPFGRVWEAGFLVFSASEIIRAHGGSCDYSSGDGQKTVRLKLPVCRFVEPA